ncbi:MAG: hypothetical protein HZB64_00270 [Rhodocyclales bacterium]|nr:hypothetical protein [Rhodocyclales bacterium]
MKRLAILFSALLLGACGNSQMASLEAGDRDHSISIIREQAYLNGPWETTLIVAGFPQCQRRYPLKGMAGDKVRITVYRPEPGVFILNSGKRWYVTALQSCGFQMYQEPPPEPGEMVGTFQVKDGVLSYLAKPPA